VRKILEILNKYEDLLVTILQFLLGLFYLWPIFILSSANPYKVPWLQIGLTIPLLLYYLLFRSIDSGPITLFSLVGLILIMSWAMLLSSLEAGTFPYPGFYTDHLHFIPGMILIIFAIWKLIILIKHGNRHDLFGSDISYQNKNSK
jgi:hypothetical protein